MMRYNFTASTNWPRQPTHLWFFIQE